MSFRTLAIVTCVAALLLGYGKLLLRPAVGLA